MSLRASDYSIAYLLGDGIPVHNIFIRLNDTFADYLKNANPNKDKYEKLLWDAMKFNKFPEDIINLVKEKDLCNWDGGLLDHIIFPISDAVGLVIEHDTDFGTIYRSHNVDRVSDMSVILTVITNYLSSMSLSFEHFKSGERGNYKIWYTQKDKIPYHDISVEISDDFLTSLKSLKVNKKYYDELALAAMKVCGVNSTFIESAEKSGVCDWDEGLLTKILLPYGDATGLILELGTPYGDVYRSHNLDDYAQMAVLMTVITNYLSDMDFFLNFKS